MAEALQEGTDIYGWINDLADSTGLSHQTLSELYLKGWVFEPGEPTQTKHDNNIVTVRDDTFWKRFRSA